MREITVSSEENFPLYQNQPAYGGYPNEKINHEFENYT
jgi:hypothetical protein